MPAVEELRFWSSGSSSAPPTWSPPPPVRGAPDAPGQAEDAAVDPDLPLEGRVTEGLSLVTSFCLLHPRVWLG